MKGLLERLALCTTLALPDLAIAQEIEEEHAKIQGELGIALSPPTLPMSEHLGLGIHGHGSITSESIVHGGVGAGFQWKLPYGNAEFVPAEIHLECHVGEPCELGYGVEGGLEGKDFGINIHLVFTPEGLEEAQLGGRWRGFALAPHMHSHEGEIEWGVRVSSSFKLGEAVHLIPGIDLSPESVTFGFRLGLGTHIHSY